MLKLVLSTSFDFGMPAASLIDVYSKGIDRCWLEKRAAVLTHEIADLRPERGHSYIQLITMGAQEWFGCFPKGTAVRMGDASAKPIETVKVGDEVVTHRGRVRFVTHTYQRSYSGPVCSLSISGMLEPVVCTSNHKFYVIPAAQVCCAIDKEDHCKPGTCRQNGLCTRRNCARAFPRYEPEWKTAEDLREGDYVLVPIPDRGVGKQTWGWSVPFARLAGYFTAEGSYRKAKTGRGLQGLVFSFGLHELDTVVKDAVECAESLKAEYGKLKINGPYLQPEAGTATLHLNCSELAIRMHRTVGEYSGEKHLSGEVFSQTPEVLSHFVATYLDGDETCPQYTTLQGYPDHRYTCGTKSRKLALDLQWILTRLGCAATVCPSNTHANGFYNISFSNPNGAFLKDKATKYRLVAPDQVKEHSFVWNGYMCRPIRENHVAELSLPVFNLEVDEDHSYTVGNGVAVKNCNRNADGFNEKRGMFELAEPMRGLDKFIQLSDGLMMYHSFFKKQAHVFKHHQNDDARKSIGEIYAEAYNPEMHRGELIIKVANNHPDWRDDIENLANGKDIPFSMATKVAYDLCSFCGHKARTRREYCDHLLNNMTDMTKSGHMVFAINDEPHFFDISKVARPADRIAWSLRKVAAYELAPIGGAALAEEFGLTEPSAALTRSSLAASRQKLAAVEKLSAIEKKVDSVARGEDNPHLKSLLGGLPEGDLPDGEMKKLKGTKLPSALGGLADAKICLSVKDFMRLVMGSSMDEDAISDLLPSVKGRLPGIFSRAKDSGESDELASDGAYDSEPTAIPRQIKEMLGSVMGDHSMAEGPVLRRIRITIIRGGPKHKLETNSEKSAAVSPQAEQIAREYAKYQLAFVSGADQSLTNELTVLRNFARV
jgi:hypothetical protein